MTLQIREQTDHHVELCATGTLGQTDYRTLAKVFHEAGPHKNIVLDVRDAEDVDGKGTAAGSTGARGR